MKRFLFFMMLGAGLASHAQTPPPPPATAADVLAGTATYKFVSPKVLADVGFGAPTNGVSAATATNIADARVAAGTAANIAAGANLNQANAAALTNVAGMTRYNVKTSPWSAAGDGSTDDTTAIQSAATRAANTSAAALGELFIPQGVYRTYNTIFLNGTYGVDFPGTTLDTGYFDVRGQASRIVAHGNTNAMEFKNGMRAMSVRGVGLMGTNNSATINANNRQNGFVFNGPGGNFTAQDTVAATFTAGYIFNDITGFRGQNMMALSNFVGFAIGFKADGVKINGRAERNYYGALFHYTNSQFTSYTTDGHPSFSGVIGYNQVGVKVMRGFATIEDAYFEGNGVAISIGVNTNNAYEATYPVATDLDVTIQRIDGVFQAIDVHVPATVRINDVGNISGTKVYLKNALADASDIRSDQTLIVQRSDTTEFFIGNGWKYLNGTIVPDSINSWTNLYDRPPALLAAANWAGYDTNQFVISDAPDEDYEGTWYWNAGTGKYTNAALAGASFELFSETVAQINDTGASALYSTSTFDVATGSATEWLDEVLFELVDLTTSWDVQVDVDAATVTTGQVTTTAGPTITSGAGAPTASAPDGSIYLRTDGSTSTTLYVRISGAWVGK